MHEVKEEDEKDFAKYQEQLEKKDGKDIEKKQLKRKKACGTRKRQRKEQRR